VGGGEKIDIDVLAWVTGWTKGRHTRGKGFAGDMEKYNEATSMGWRLIRVTPSNLLANNTFRLIDNILKL
jgi:hypothetical protein